MSIRNSGSHVMGGEDKAIELILDKMWELKSIGVSMFILGHTKKRTMTDVVTGTEYDMLTTNMAHRYFNAIKTKLHVLGVASINRDIEKTVVKQMVGKDKVVGKVLDESRIITFRDDNFNIDSKSRFADITPYVSLDTDSFINAIEDAIKVAHDKQTNKKSIEETKVEQSKEKEDKFADEILKINKTKVNVSRNEELTDVIKIKFTGASADAKEKIKSIMDEYGIESMKNVDTNPTEALEKIVKLL